MIKTGASNKANGSVQLQLALIRDYIALDQPQFAQSHAQRIREYRQDKAAKGEAVSRVPGIEIDTSAALAEVDIALGDYSAAQQELQQMSNADVHGEPDVQLDLLRVLGHTHKQLGQENLAIESGRQGMVLIDQVREQMDVRQSTVRWRSRTASMISDYVYYLLDAYKLTSRNEHLAEAFDVLQRNRGVSLTLSRVLSRVDQETSEDVERLLQKSREHAREALASHVLKTEIKSPGDGHSYEELYRASRKPFLIGDFPELSYLSIPEIQERLGNRSALSYVVADEMGFGLLIERDSIQVFDLLPKEELVDLIKKSLQEISSYQPSDYASTRALSEVLQVNRASESEILLEASGELSSIPFLALASLTSVTYEPIALAKQVVMVPSLSVYLGNEQVVSYTDRLDIAIFADPDYSSIDSPFELSSMESSAFSQWRSGIGRLPYTALEAEKIMSQFAQQKTRLHTGADATIRNLIDDEVRSSRIIHLASHGFTSQFDPNHVGMLLAAEGERNSGFLTLKDIGQHRFEADLVVISGCETARGEAIPGEGMIGLSRAFLAQGAKSTIATLWPIEDRSSAVFMDHFYAALSENPDSPALALSTAQRRMLASTRYRRPAYWAPFILNAISPMQISSGTDSQASLGEPKLP